MVGTNSSFSSNSGKSDAQMVNIGEAASLLREAELVAMPTETVYGLAARADSDEAIAKIYKTKGRPDFNPLIVHIASISKAQEIAHFDERALLLAERFWPGALTLVLPLRDDARVSPAVTAGLPTIALRSPAHALARQLLEETGLPLAAPSANRSTGISPTCPEHVIASLGDRCVPIIDGGTCEQGVESTIIALREGGDWDILRPGPIAREEIERALGVSGDGSLVEGRKVEVPQIEAPGQMSLHYSPGKPVRLNAAEAKEGEFLIGFGKIKGDCSLSPAGDLAQAASRLYSCLHEAQAAPQGGIAIAPIPSEGLGEAINDRLSRASAS